VSAWLIALGWVVCGVVAYRMFRYGERHVSGGLWTVASRRVGLLIALVGPVGLLAVAVAHWLVISPGDEPASW